MFYLQLQDFLKLGKCKRVIFDSLTRIELCFDFDFTLFTVFREMFLNASRLTALLY